MPSFLLNIVDVLNSLNPCNNESITNIINTVLDITKIVVGLQFIL